MDLFDRVSQDIVSAMKAKDKLRLETLRGIKKEFIEAKTAKSASAELTDDVAITILQKMEKQRRDSAQIYTQQDRQELAEKELEEATIINSYLPKQLTQEELEARIKVIISESGASSMADMGKVMGIASKSLVGITNGKAISETVKRLLA